MAPKKGKKPLSPEEKKIRAEMLALKAEEARKKKEDEERARLQRIQKNEENICKENMREIHNQWRKIMRVAKAKDLQQEVQILAEEHENQVQRKDRIIENLFKELEEAEGQHQTAFAKHLQIMDGLIDLHYTRLKIMEEEFEERLNTLETAFHSEKQGIIKSNEKQKKELMDVMTAMEIEHKEREAEIRQDYESSREEAKNKNMEEYNVLKISLENAIQDLEHKIEETHQAYLGSTDAKTQSFKKLVEKDKVTAKLIEQRMRKLLHIHESIAYWRAKIATHSREWEGINKALRDQKDYVNKHYQNLKRKLSKMRNSEHEKLKAISKASEEVRLDLTKKLEMADRIIRLGEINNKLETEHERIFPFDPLHCSAISTISESEVHNIVTEAEDPAKRSHELVLGGADKIRDEKDDGTICRYSSYAADENGNEVEEWNYLSKFQKRYNKVMLDKLALDLEKQKLESENKNLRLALQGYLDGLTVNDTILKGPMNTLLVVNSWKS